MIEKFAEKAYGNEPEYIEKALDYFGENGFIDGQGFRRKKTDEEIEEEKVIKLAEEEPLNNKILIVKGADNIMEFTNLQESIEAFLEQGVEEEYFEVEKVLTEATKKTLLEAMNTLNKFKSEIAKNKELKEAIIALAKYLGYGYPGIPAKYPYPTKKGLEKREPVSWLTIRNQLFGELVEPDEVEVEKSDITSDDPFPSISKQIERNKEIISETIEENNISEGERFI